MSIRITKGMRQNITAQLIKLRFDKQRSELKRKENEVALKVYHLQYDAKARAAMAALPDGWLPTTHRVRLLLNGRGVDLITVDPVQVLAVDEHRYIELDKAKAARIKVEIDKLHADEEVLKRTIRCLHEKTNSTIASFGSIKRLVEAWPEIKPFTDRLGYDTAKKSLPAVIPADLNTSLGLPVSG